MAADKEITDKQKKALKRLGLFDRPAQDGEDKGLADHLLEMSGTHSISFSASEDSYRAIRRAKARYGAPMVSDLLGAICKVILEYGNA